MSDCPVFFLKSSRSDWYRVESLRLRLGPVCCSRVVAPGRLLPLTWCRGHPDNPPAPHVRASSLSPKAEQSKVTSEEKRTSVWSKRQLSKLKSSAGIKAKTQPS